MQGTVVCYGLREGVIEVASFLVKIVFVGAIGELITGRIVANDDGVRMHLEH